MNLFFSLLNCKKKL